MTKEKAIQKFVNELDAIPTEWIRTIAEHKDGNFPLLPMWGTMWILEDFSGEELIKEHSRVMSEGVTLLEERLDEMDIDERKRVQRAIKDEDWSIIEDYVDEEMAGEHCILDSDGSTTAMYIYEVDNRFVLGVNGAGWNFYDGVWDRLYDLLGLQWHEEEPKL